VLISNLYWLRDGIFVEALAGADTTRVLAALAGLLPAATAINSKSTPTTRQNVHRVLKKYQPMRPTAAATQASIKGIRQPPICSTALEPISRARAGLARSKESADFEIRGLQTWVRPLWP